MKVALIDLDIEKGKTRHRHPFPNLALMKLSAWHKQKGDEVSLNFPLGGADAVYASCVFTWHRNRQADVPLSASIGGPGISGNEVLPSEVEHIMPDYDLYNGTDFSMGFTSRGCIRHCPWCKVPETEGKIQAWTNFREFWDRRHSRILLLDNNLLASPNCRETLLELAANDVRVDFTQGLDIRLITEDNAQLLRQVKLDYRLRFAFDDIGYEESVKRGVATLLRAGFRSRHLSFYVLVAYGGDRTALERLKLLHSLNVEVYPMVYKDDSGREHQLDVGTVPDILFHGNRANIRKFLRVVGRLRW